MAATFCHNEKSEEIVRNMNLPVLKFKVCLQEKLGG
jgi:hypothetical protein